MKTLSTLILGFLVFTSCGQTPEKGKIKSKESSVEVPQSNTEQSGQIKTIPKESSEPFADVKIVSDKSRIIKQKTQNLIAFDVYGMNEDQVAAFKSYIEGYDDNIIAVVLDVKNGFFTLSLTVSQKVKKDNLLGMFKNYGISNIVFNGVEQ